MRGRQVNRRRRAATCISLDRALDPPTSWCARVETPFTSFDYSRDEASSRRSGAMCRRAALGATFKKSPARTVVQVVRRASAPVETPFTACPYTAGDGSKAQPTLRSGWKFLSVERGNGVYIASASRRVRVHRTRGMSTRERPSRPGCARAPYAIG